MSKIGLRLAHYGTAEGKHRSQNVNQVIDEACVPFRMLLSAKASLMLGFVSATFT